jgi:nicotinamide mononucleotide transporter
MDSALLIFSMLAQFLLMTRKYQTWMFWIVVNLISVPLYVSQDLSLTAALYGIFFLNSVWGFTAWKKLLDTPAAISQEPA